MSCPQPCPNLCPRAACDAPKICATKSAKAEKPSKKDKLEAEAIAQKLDAKIDAETVRRNEFLDHTASRVMFHEIRRLVDCAKSAQLDELNMKRERLRAFLAHEQECYDYEFRVYMSRRSEDDINQRKDSLAALQREREEERLQVVERQRLKQVVINNDVLRSEIHHEMLLGSKRDQLLQIEDRKTQKAIEKDIDRMWHDIGMKRLKEQNREALAREQVAFMNSKCCQEELKMQIANKKSMTERETIEPMCCVHGELPKEQEDKELIQRQNAIKNAAALKVQAEENRVRNENIKREVEELEASILATCLTEIENEKKAIKMNKRILYRESMIYLDFLESMKCQRKMNEQELDRLIDAINKKLLDDKATSRCAGLAKKREFQKSVHAERWQQILERADKRRFDSNQRLCEAIVEREINAEAIARDREEAAKRLMGRIEHAKYLLKQAKEIEQFRADAEQRTMDEINRIQNEKKALEDKATMMFRNSSFAFSEVHPNTQVVNNAKHNAL